MANQSSGQGRAKDPQHDGRLKDNRDDQQSQASTGGSRQHGGQQDGREGNHGQGRVNDPGNDGRLKQNR